MNLYFLKYFTDTYRLKSIALAAKLNNLSSTAVSKGIRSLEDSLGLELIEHKKNQLIFTKSADRIYNDALEILSKVSSLTDNLTVAPQTTKIGIIHSLATGRLSKVISHLSETKDIQVSIGNPTEIENLFSRYIIDMGITLKRELPQNSSDVILHEGSFHLYESTEVSKKKQVIYLTPEWPEVLSFKKNSDLFINPQYKICVIDSWDAIYSAVKKGGGIGLLPDYFKIGNSKIKKSRLSSFSYPYCVVLKYHNSSHDEEMFKMFKARFS